MSEEAPMLTLKRKSIFDRRAYPCKTRRCICIKYCGREQPRQGRGDRQDSRHDALVKKFVCFGCKMTYPMFRSVLFLIVFAGSCSAMLRKRCFGGIERDRLRCPLVGVVCGADAPDVPPSLRSVVTGVPLFEN